MQFYIVILEAQNVRPHSEQHNCCLPPNEMFKWFITTHLGWHLPTVCFSVRC